VSQQDYDKELVHLATLVPQILHINTAIQIQHKQLSLNGKNIICVALDGTCSFDDKDVSEIKLTSAQIAELVEQTKRHNGKLDENNRGRVSHIDANGKKGIMVENDLELEPNSIRLNARQALSLLAWLKQEETTLTIGAQQ
jgi:hypothetical protein